MACTLAEVHLTLVPPLESAKVIAGGAECRGADIIHYAFTANALHIERRSFPFSTAIKAVAAYADNAVFTAFVIHDGGISSGRALITLVTNTERRDAPIALPNNDIVTAALALTENTLALTSADGRLVVVKLTSTAANIVYSSSPLTTEKPASVVGRFMGGIFHGGATTAASSPVTQHAYNDAPIVGIIRLTSTAVMTINSRGRLVRTDVSTKTCLAETIHQADTLSQASLHYVYEQDFTSTSSSSHRILLYAVRAGMASFELVTVHDVVDGTQVMEDNDEDDDEEEEHNNGFAFSASIPSPHSTLPLRSALISGSYLYAMWKISRRKTADDQCIIKRVNINTVNDNHYDWETISISNNSSDAIRSSSIYLSLMQPPMSVSSTPLIVKSDIISAMRPLEHVESISYPLTDPFTAMTIRSTAVNGIRDLDIQVPLTIQQHPTLLTVFKCLFTFAQVYHDSFKQLFSALYRASSLSSSAGAASSISIITQDVSLPAVEPLTIRQSITQCLIDANRSSSSAERVAQRRFEAECIELINAMGGAELETVMETIISSLDLHKSTQPLLNNNAVFISSRYEQTAVLHTYRSLVMARIAFIECILPFALYITQRSMTSSHALLHIDTSVIPRLMVMNQSYRILEWLSAPQTSSQQRRSLTTNMNASMTPSASSLQQFQSLSLHSSNALTSLAGDSAYNDHSIAASIWRICLDEFHRRRDENNNNINVIDYALELMKRLSTTNDTDFMQMCQSLIDTYPISLCSWLHAVIAVGQLDPRRLSTLASFNSILLNANHSTEIDISTCQLILKSAIAIYSNNTIDSNNNKNITELFPIINSAIQIANNNVSQAVLLTATSFAATIDCLQSLLALLTMNDQSNNVSDEHQRLIDSLISTFVDYHLVHADYEEIHALITSPTSPSLSSSRRQQLCRQLVSAMSETNEIERLCALTWHQFSLNNIVEEVLYDLAKPHRVGGDDTNSHNNNKHYYTLMTYAWSRCEWLTAARYMYELALRLQNECHYNTNTLTQISQALSTVITSLQSAGVNNYITFLSSDNNNNNRRSIENDSHNDFNMNIDQQQSQQQQQYHIITLSQVIQRYHIINAQLSLLSNIKDLEDNNASMITPINQILPLIDELLSHRLYNAAMTFALQMTQDRSVERMNALTAVVSALADAYTSQQKPAATATANIDIDLAALVPASFPPLRTAAGDNDDSTSNISLTDEDSGTLITHPILQLITHIIARFDSSTYHYKLTTDSIRRLLPATTSAHTSISVSQHVTAPQWMAICHIRQPMTMNTDGNHSHQLVTSFDINRATAVMRGFLQCGRIDLCSAIIAEWIEWTITNKQVQNRRHNNTAEILQRGSSSGLEWNVLNDVLRVTTAIRSSVGGNNLSTSQLSIIEEVEQRIHHITTIAAA